MKMQIAQQTLSRILIFALLLMVGIIQAKLIMISAYIAVVLSMAALFFMLFINAPVGLLMILIFFFPFSGTEVFKTAMAEIPGFKPLQILSAAVFAVALLNVRSAVQQPPPAKLFFASIIAIFTISFLRSVPHLATINPMLTQSLSIPHYFLSQYFKPLIFFIPALVITQYVYTEKDIDRVVATINWSISGLALAIIGFFILDPDLILDPRSTRTFYADSFGMHTNSIANYFIIGMPFVLTDLFRKKVIIGMLKIVVCGIAVGLLFSRSAYFIFVFSILTYLFISKRAKWLPIFLVVILALLISLPERITERATKGFYSMDRNEISAGRVDNIWLPLIKEIADDPKAVMFGQGRYATVSSEAHKKKLIIQAMHPHNMYLEMVMDAGLVGLLLVMGLFAYLLRKVYLCISIAGHDRFREYEIAVMTSLLCFLLSGVTDRTFFPDEINGYLWMTVALAFVLNRHLEHNPEVESSQTRLKYAN
jgi:O-antigen ligase